MDRLDPYLLFAIHLILKFYLKKMRIALLELLKYFSSKS